MKTVKCVEISSGWGNVQNSIVFADQYFGTHLCKRENSGYDRSYSVELPDGYEYISDKENGVFAIVDPDGACCSELFVDDGKFVLADFGTALNSKIKYLRIV